MVDGIRHAGTLLLLCRLLWLRLRLLLLPRHLLWLVRLLLCLQPYAVFVKFVCQAFYCCPARSSNCMDVAAHSRPACSHTGSSKQHRLNSDPMSSWGRGQARFRKKKACPVQREVILWLIGCSNGCCCQDAVKQAASSAGISKVHSRKLFGHQQLPIWDVHRQLWQP